MAAYRRIVDERIIPLAWVRLFRLFTFLLDKNGQLNYNIDITEPKAWIT